MKGKSEGRYDAKTHSMGELHIPEIPKEVKSIKH